jgi:hypothetical protein
VKKKFADLFLDYFNNFLTVQAFASYYHWTYERAERIIAVGRLCQEQGRPK